MVCRFELASLENSFAKHHAAAHLTSDAVGFALAMAWAAAAIVRTKASSEGSGLLACAPHMILAAAVALAATAHSQLRSTYLKRRAVIIVVLRVLAVAAGIVLQFSVATAASAGAATVALGVAMLPLQYFQLTLLPLVWRLRARQHLVLNLASLAAVAACDGRLAAAVLAQPPAAKLVASGHAGELMTVIAWLAAQVCICLVAVLLALHVNIQEHVLTAKTCFCSIRYNISNPNTFHPQVLFGFLLPVVTIVNEERNVRARFLNAYVLHHATAFALGSLRLGVPQQWSRQPTAARRAMDAAVALVPRQPTPAQAIVRTVSKAFAADTPAEVSRPDDFESVSTHGSKLNRDEWKTAARAAVAQHRATAQQSSQAQPSDSAFCLAVEIMSRRPISSR